MTFTKADLIAAREATDMISKEAEFPKIFGGDPVKQKQAKAAYELFDERQKSPEYWRVLANEELAGLDGQDLIDGQKAFVEKHSKLLIKDVEDYNKLNQGAASGGMLDRYSGSAGALGLGIGALLGGVIGGKSGALIGALIGGIGLYAMQKLGIGGDALQNFFKTTVDKVLGPQAGRVDKDKMLKDIQSAAKEATGAPLEEAPSPATDAVAFGETDPSNPNYNAGVSALAPAGDFTPTIASVKQSAMDQFGEELTDGEASEILTGVMPGAEFTPEAVGDWLSKNRRPVDPLVSAAPPAPADPNTGVTEPPRVEPITPPLPRGISAATAPAAPVPEVVEAAQPKLSPEEVIQNYKDTQTPTQLPPAVKPVPTGNTADDMEAQIEYENQLNVRKELAKTQQEYADRTKDPVETKRLQDAADARVIKAREQMKRSKSAIGQYKPKLKAGQEFTKTTAEGIGEGFEQAGEGIVEAGGVVKDVGKAGLNKVKETTGGAKAVLSEAAGLGKDVADAGVNEAKVYGKQATNWLKDKRKDLKYLLSGD